MTDTIHGRQQHRRQHLEVQYFRTSRWEEEIRRAYPIAEHSSDENSITKVAGDWKQESDEPADSQAENLVDGANEYERTERRDVIAIDGEDDLLKE